MSPAVSLQAIVDALGGVLIGADAPIQRLSPIETAQPGSLSFVSHARFARQIDTTGATALIVTPALADAAQLRGPCIVTNDVYLYFARLTQFWKAKASPPAVSGVHPTAVVDVSARVHASACLGPCVVVGPGASIGAHARLDAHVVLEAGAEVGDHTHLHAHVVLGQGCRIGRRGVVHSGAVIGADGFGFAPHNGAWLKIEQLGAVRIGDDVEIGANTCIDRGALDDTVLEDGVKLDNLVQIGHNVHVGAHTAMAGCAGVAGSARIGAHCTVGGGAVVLGHLSLADHVHVSAASVVTRSLRKPGHYTGVFPLDDNASWEKNAATLKQLHALRERIKKLERP